MPILSLIRRPALLAALLFAAGLSYSSVANAQLCDLCNLARAGNLAEIERRCEDADAAGLVKARNERTGRTALLMAARHQREELVSALLGQINNCEPAIPNVPNINDRTPLMWAAQHGNWKIADDLIDVDDSPAHLNYLKDDGRMAADIALEHQKYDFLVSFLARGGKFADVDDDHVSATHTYNYLVSQVTAQFDTTGSLGIYEPVLEAVLQHRTYNPAYGGRNGSLLFHWAVANSQRGLLEKMIADVADGNSDVDLSSDDAAEIGRLVDVLLLFSSRSPDYALLHVASSEEDVDDADFVRILLALGVNVNKKDRARNSALHLAARNNHDGIAAVLVEHPDIDLNAKNNRGRTPLHSAASEGQAAAASVLVAANLSPNIRDSGGHTPLYLAVSENEGDVVRALIMHPGLQVNQTFSSDGRTALHFAADRGYSDVVAALVDDRELRVNQGDRALDTALHIAVRGTLTSVVSALLQHRYLRVDQENAEGETALDLAVDFAVRGEDSDMVSDLLDHSVSAGYPILYSAAEGGDVDVLSILIGHDRLNVNRKDGDGDAALHIAVRHNQTLVVSALVNQGRLDVNQKDVDGDTALLIAVQNNQPPMVSALIEASSLDASLTNRFGNAALHIAARTNRVSVVSALLQHSGLDVNQTNHLGKVALYIAAERGYSAVVSALVGHDDVNLNLTNRDGKTALDIATEMGYSDVVSILAGLNANSGYSALYSAVRNNEAAAVSVLIRDGNLDANRKEGSSGNAALHIAAEEGHPDVVSVLVGHDDVNVNLTNRDGKTAVYIAAERRYSAVVSILAGLDRDAAYSALYSAVRDNQVAEISILIESGNLDANREEESSGDAALHIAAKEGFSDVVAFLVGHDGVSVNLTNRAGKTAVYIAAERRYSAVVSILAGLNRDAAYSALYSAARNNQAAAVSALIRGGNLDANREEESSGNAALHIAAEEGHPAVVSALVGHVSVNLTNRAGKTALDIAIERGRSGAVSILAGLNQGAAYSALYSAVRNNQAAAVSALIRGGNLDANREEESSGNAALHIAAEEGHPAVVSALVGHVSVNLTNRAGKTAVYIAAERRYSDVVSVLTEDDAASGHAALHKAAEIGGAVAVSVLIRDGNLNANHQNRDGNAALHIAAIEDRPGVASVLVGYGSVNVNLTNSLGNSALHIAVDRNRPSVVSVLVEHDRLSVNLVNRAGKTATDIAFARHRETAISLIVRGNGVFKDHDVFAGSHLITLLGGGETSSERSANEHILRVALNEDSLNPPYGNETSLFHWAVSQRDRDLIDALVRDADASDSEIDLSESDIDDIADYLSGLTSRSRGGEFYTAEDALMHAVLQDNVNKANYIRVLLELGLNKEHSDYVFHSGSPFTQAVQHGYVDAASVLIDSDNMNRQDLNNYGKRPLHLAAYWNRASMVTFLLRKGADPELDDYYPGFVPFPRTPVMAAAYRNTRNDALQSFINYGVNVNYVVSARTAGSRWSVLNFANVGRAEQNISYLISHNADIKNPESTSHPFLSAFRYGSVKVMTAYINHEDMGESHNVQAYYEAIYGAIKDVLVHGWEGNADRTKRLRNLRLGVMKMGTYGMDCGSNFPPIHGESSFISWFNSAFATAEARGEYRAQELKDIMRNHCPQWPSTSSAPGASGVAGASGGGVAGASGESIRYYPPDENVLEIIDMQVLPLETLQ